MANRTPSKQAAKTNKGKAAPQRATSASTPAAGTGAGRPALLDARVRNDLAGVAVAVLAVVLLVIVLMPGDAIGSQMISDVIHSLVGIGAVILPFLLIAWAATFFIRQRLTAKPLRLIIGLGVIYLAVISLAAAFIPGASQDAAQGFAPSRLAGGGGYIGGALAWALLSAVGPVATTIILTGLIVVGLVLIGFSISRITENLGNRLARRREAREQEDERLNASVGGAYQMGPVTALAVPEKGRGKSRGWGFGKGSAGGSASGGSGSGSGAGLNPTRLAGKDDGLVGDDLFSASFEQGDQGVLPYAASADLGFTRRMKAAAANGGLAAVDAAAGDAAAGAAGAGTAGAGAPAAALTKKRSRSKRGSTQQSDDTAPSPFQLPDPRVLRVSREKAATKAGAAELRSTAARLQATFEEFGVEGQVIGWIAGPTVTLYKVSLGEGVRLNRITNLQDDIQLALAAQAIRIVAPIPGTSLVGVEIPNDTRNTVLLGDVLASAQSGPLQLAVGKDVEGDAVIADLATMPHLLIGGTTGSGKSVAINAMIMSILMRATPEEVRMIMIDPKMVELSLYNGIPHLYVPVVTDAHQAAAALSWAVAEMERRLKVFGKHGLKNIKQFNARVAEELARRALEEERAATRAATADEADEADKADAGAAGADEADVGAAGAETLLLDPSCSTTDKPDAAAEQDALRAKMPYIVIGIDELADLMMVAGKDVETSISRLAQLARAAGLHLIVATQRPSTTVITGLIKANIVNRIAFTVASGIDSRVILDANGAEDLIGTGDLLFSRPEYSRPSRIQGCFVSETEIETVVEYLRSQGEPDYHEGILEARPSPGANSDGEPLGEDDPLLWEAADIVVSTGLGSTSTLQRRLKVGYARAGRIMDMLEGKGIVGPPNGSKPREVLIDDVLDLETLKAYEQ
ncbi:MAG: DNA translocase FtsK 4TM domain-containing protein [Coriobacteriales bacterium]|nr:DNA translocase FtsK 4TM domain-containing protein [Coriobacteriales bacterium]